LDEIATKLGQSRGNVRNHYFRGLDKLREPTLDFIGYGECQHKLLAGRPYLLGCRKSLLFPSSLRWFNFEVILQDVIRSKKTPSLCLSR
jgi:hypothetical protein